MPELKICFIGLGSIGKRHLTNLTNILRERGVSYEIHALRTTLSPLPEELAKSISNVFTSYEELDADYDIAFVTNPTIKHYETLKNILPRAKHLFIEKPVFMETKKPLDSLPLKEGSVYYVAAPLRYNSVFPMIEKIVRENKIYSARAICSSYLPEWRKNTDYRKNYSARKDMGGGVTLDLIHEWDYLKHLFGTPSSVSHICSQKSDLEIDSDDIAVYAAEYPDKIIELHLDYFGRRSRRELELFTKYGTYKADFVNQTVVFDDGQSIQELPIEKIADPYVAEMNCFLDLCLENSRENPNTIQSAFETLKISLGELE